MSRKFQEYPAMTEIRNVMRKTRGSLQLSMPDVAEALATETGYDITHDTYRAIEQGITKHVPIWVVVAFMRVYNVSPDEMFGYCPDGPDEWQRPPAPYDYSEEA